MNRLTASAAIILCVGGGVFLGRTVLGLGFALGAVAATINLVGLWFGIRLFANATFASEKPGTSPLAIVLLCFVKMPIFIFAGFIAWRLGSGAPGAFLSGVGLVYSLMIWCAIGAR